MELKALDLSKNFSGKNAVNEVNISVFSGEMNIVISIDDIIPKKKKKKRYP